MELSAALFIGLIAALAPVFVGLGALVGSWYATKTSAKQSELQALRVRVDQLFEANNKLHAENLRLREYVFDLKRILEKQGIELPTYKNV